MRSWKDCSCGRSYTRRTWATLNYVGVGTYEPGAQHEFRSCVCRSTMCVATGKTLLRIWGVLADYPELNVGFNWFDQARLWADWGFGPASTREWLSSGCFDPKIAYRLSQLGIGYWLASQQVCIHASIPVYGRLGEIAARRRVTIDQIRSFLESKLNLELGA